MMCISLDHVLHEGGDKRIMATYTQKEKDFLKELMEEYEEDDEDEEDN